MEFPYDPQTNHMAMTHTFEYEKLPKIPLRPPNQAHGNDPHLKASRYGKHKYCWRYETLHVSIFYFYSLWWNTWTNATWKKNGIHKVNLRLFS